MKIFRGLLAYIMPIIFAGLCSLMIVGGKALDRKEKIVFIESGSTVLMNRMSDDIPKQLISFISPPWFSNFGIPRDFLQYKFCAKNETYFENGNKSIPSEIKILEVRLKPSKDQTIQLGPNDIQCIPFKERIEYFFGIAKASSLEGGKQLKLMNKKQITLVTHSTLFTTSEYDSEDIFLALIILFYPALWTLIILWISIHKFVLGKI